jgi:glycosyltransferase involved in cell wall biosynthesis
LHAYLAEHHLAERVTFHHHIPSEEMPAFYKALDALVLPSLSKPNWKEQFGRVLIEAMACGVPVVGSDSGEIPRVIGDAGMITPEGQATALAQALASLRDDNSLRQKLGRAGRERVLATYTHTRIAEATCEVYRWLASGRYELPTWDYQGEGTR